MYNHERKFSFTKKKKIKIKIKYSKNFLKIMIKLFTLFNYYNFNFI